MVYVSSGDDIDSGMESSSKAASPCKIDEDFDDEEDETLSERLWALTEMFPESVRNVTSSMCSGTVKTVKFAYSFTRSATWIFFSSSVILFAPVILEMEMANMKEAERREHKQVLLGPNAALTGGPPTVR